MEWIRSVTCIALLILVSAIFGVEPGLHSDYGFDPSADEGYFQGWNFSYHDRERNLYATFLVSNLGPNDMNNGISLVLYTAKTGSQFLTREFAEEDLKVEKKSLHLKMAENEMVRDSSNHFIIHQKFPDTELYLEFTPNQARPIRLSNGEFLVKEPDSTLRADEIFTFSFAYGYLIRNGEKAVLTGQGSMEHFRTNYAVYHYSKRWEILRSISKDGTRLISGGFLGTSTFPHGFFQTYYVSDSRGRILYEGKVTNIETVSEFEEPFSSYTLPKEQVLTLDGKEECKILVRNLNPVGRVNMLHDISAVLRFFIRIFFAKPYQLHFRTSLEWNCPEKPTDSTEFKGIHSFYLVNP